MTLYIILQGYIHLKYHLSFNHTITESLRGGHFVSQPVHITTMEIDQDIFPTIILPLLLIQDG